MDFSVSKRRWRACAIYATQVVTNFIIKKQIIYNELTVAMHSAPTVIFFYFVEHRIHDIGTIDILLSPGLNRFQSLSVCRYLIFIKFTDFEMIIFIEPLTKARMLNTLKEPRLMISQSKLRRVSV